MRQSFRPISVFCHEPYSRILAYPDPTKRQVAARLAELRRLGISKVSFQGSTKVGNVDVLGKGYVGVVVLARRGSRTVALKIRRLDSQREGMGKEAEMLKLANKAGVGPRLVSASRNFLIMEYLSGEKIGRWFADVKVKGSTRKVKSVVKKVLKDCHRLDRNGLDHGELSSISKHVIVGTKTTIVDFESSSVKRRAANVTSAAQGIFIGSGISRKIRRVYKLPRKDRIISTLRNYKGEPSQENFDGILGALKL